MGKNMEGAAPGLGEGEAASVLTPITQGSKGWSAPRVRDGQASTLLSKLQPSLTHHHHSSASSWELHTPAKRPFHPAVAHSLGSGTPSPGRRTSYLLGVGMLPSWVYLQRRQRRAGLRGWVCGSRGASSPTHPVCVSGDAPDTSPPNCPSCSARKGGRDRAQHLCSGRQAGRHRQPRG